MNFDDLIEEDIQIDALLTQSKDITVCDSNRQNNKKKLYSPRTVKRVLVITERIKKEEPKRFWKTVTDKVNMATDRFGNNALSKGQIEGIFREQNYSSKVRKKTAAAAASQISMTSDSNTGVSSSNDTDKVNKQHLNSGLLNEQVVSLLPADTKHDWDGDTNVEKGLTSPIRGMISPMSSPVVGFFPSPGVMSPSSVDQKRKSCFTSHTPDSGSDADLEVVVSMTQSTVSASNSHSQPNTAKAYFDTNGTVGQNDQLQPVDHSLDLVTTPSRTRSNSICRERTPESPAWSPDEYLRIAEQTAQKNKLAQSTPKGPQLDLWDAQSPLTDSGADCGDSKVGMNEKRTTIVYSVVKDVVGAGTGKVQQVRNRLLTDAEEQFAYYLERAGVDMPGRSIVELHNFDNIEGLSVSKVIFTVEAYLNDLDTLNSYKCDKDSLHYTEMRLMFLILYERTFHLLILLLAMPCDLPMLPGLAVDDPVEVAASKLMPALTVCVKAAQSASLSSLHDFIVEKQWGSVVRHFQRHAAVSSTHTDKCSDSPPGTVLEIRIESAHIPSKFCQSIAPINKNLFPLIDEEVDEEVLMSDQEDDEQCDSVGDENDHDGEEEESYHPSDFENRVLSDADRDYLQTLPATPRDLCDAVGIAYFECSEGDEGIRTFHAALRSVVASLEHTFSVDMNSGRMDYLATDRLFSELFRALGGQDAEASYCSSIRRALIQGDLEEVVYSSLTDRDAPEAQKAEQNLSDEPKLQETHHTQLEQQRVEDSLGDDETAQKQLTRGQTLSLAATEADSVFASSDRISPLRPFGDGVSRRQSGDYKEDECEQIMQQFSEICIVSDVNSADACCQQNDTAVFHTKVKATLKSPPPCKRFNLSDSPDENDLNASNHRVPLPVTTSVVSKISLQSLSFSKTLMGEQETIAQANLLTCESVHLAHSRSEAPIICLGRLKELVVLVFDDFMNCSHSEEVGSAGERVLPMRSGLHNLPVPNQTDNAVRGITRCRMGIGDMNALLDKKELWVEPKTHEEAVQYARIRIQLLTMFEKAMHNVIHFSALPPMLNRGGAKPDLVPVELCVEELLPALKMVVESTNSPFFEEQHRMFLNLGYMHGVLSHIQPQLHVHLKKAASEEDQDSVRQRFVEPTHVSLAFESGEVIHVTTLMPNIDTNKLPAIVDDVACAPDQQVSALCAPVMTALQLAADSWGHQSMRLMNSPTELSVMVAHQEADAFFGETLKAAWFKVVDVLVDKQKQHGGASQLEMVAVAEEMSSIRLHVLNALKLAHEKGSVYLQDAAETHRGVIIRLQAKLLELHPTGDYNSLDSQQMRDTGEGATAGILVESLRVELCLTGRDTLKISKSLLDIFSDVAMTLSERRAFDTQFACLLRALDLDVF